MPSLDDVTQRERQSRHAILDGLPPREAWRIPLEEQIGPLFDSYLANRLALDRYLDGAAERALIKDMFAQHRVRITQGHCWRLLQRCIAKNPKTGELNGYWGCVPRWSPKASPDDPSKSPFGKQLTKFFIRHPDIEAALCAFAIGVSRSKAPPLEPASEEGGARKSAGTKVGSAVAKMRPIKVWDKFMSLCRAKGLHEGAEYPFDKAADEGRCAREAIRRWYQKKKYLTPSLAARNELGVDLGALIGRDYKRLDQTPLARPMRLVYEEVQLDEKYLDAMWTAFLPLADERWKAISTRRLWGLGLVDAETRMSLASGVSYGARYSTEDVLRIIHNAINPPARYAPRLIAGDYRYFDSACFPSELPEFRRNSFQQLSMDSDSAHLADHTLEALERTMGCKVVSKNVGESEARSPIEGFFPLLSRACEMLPSATGNRHDSPARRNPEVASVQNLVYMPWAGELLDMICRNYNVTPQVRLGGMTPLKRAKELASKGRLFRNEVGEFGASNLYLLLPRHRAVLGCLRHKRTGAPLGVRLNDAFYTSKALNRDKDLRWSAKDGVTMYVQEDARFAFVVADAFPDRVYKVALTGPFASVAHTLAMRSMTMAMGRSVTTNHRARHPNLMLGALEGLDLAGRDKAALRVLFGGFLAFADRAGRNELCHIDLPPEGREQMLAEARELTHGFVESDEPDESDERGRDAEPAPAVYVPPVKPVWTPTGPDPFGILGPRTAV